MTNKKKEIIKAMQTLGYTAEKLTWRIIDMFKRQNDISCNCYLELKELLKFIDDLVEASQWKESDQLNAKCMDCRHIAPLIRFLGDDEGDGKCPICGSSDFMIIN